MDLEVLMIDNGLNGVYVSNERIHFFVVVQLRVSASCWVSVGGCSQVLVAALSLYQVDCFNMAAQASKESP